MPLELATRLILRDSQDGRPLPQERVREITAWWAEVPTAASEPVEGAVGRGGSRVTTRQVDLDTGRRRWDLTLDRADDHDPTVVWRVEVTAIFDPDRTSYVVRLRRESHDHRLRPLTGSPAPPRVIRDLLGADGVDCFDGPLRIGPRWRELRASDVMGFVATQLLAEDRRLPVIAVAKTPPAAQGRLEVHRLTQDLAGFAHVLLLDRAALAPLGTELANLSVAPSSARLWWPGVQLDDESATHPHWVGPFDHPQNVAEAIRELVLTVSRERWREPSRVIDFDRDLRRRREDLGRATAARLTDEIARLRASAAADRARSEHVTTARTVDITKYEQELERAAGDVAELEEQLEAQRTAAEDYYNQWAEVEERRTELERDNRSLRGQIEGLKAQLRSRPREEIDEQTPEQLFGAEVRATWRDRLTDDDRDQYPLTTFVVREGFLESIARAGADRQKVIATAMEVACNRAKDIEGRQLHKLRTGAAGNSPERRRSSDGAVAWRCNLQTNSPAARRLHFWQCPNGRIELVSIVPHDDFRIAD